MHFCCFFVAFLGAKNLKNPTRGGELVASRRVAQKRKAISIRRNKTSLPAWTDWTHMLGRRALVIGAAAASKLQGVQLQQEDSSERRLFQK